MTGQQQLQISDAHDASPNGMPQNQSGGNNVVYNTDGTCSAPGAFGVLPTPTNWFNNAPVAGIANLYWIKATDTGGSGTATALTGPSISAFTTLASGLQAFIPNGQGSRTYSYQISSNSTGSPVLASGTGIINNNTL